MAVIEVANLSKRYGPATVLQNVNFRIEAGETVALVGGSGAGKSTLLRQILALEPPDGGQVQVLGQPIYPRQGTLPAAFFRQWGVMFQGGALFSALTVFDNVAFPLRELRVLDEPDIAALVYEKLALAGVDADHAGKLPAELSGGLVKRVALARALILDPQLLILDEPTAGLDPQRSRNFVSLLQQLRATLPLTVLMVSHDVEAVSSLCSRLLALADRTLAADCSVEAARVSPHPFLQEFFSTSGVHAQEEAWKAEHTASS